MRALAARHPDRIRRSRAQGRADADRRTCGKSLARYDSVMASLAPAFLLAMPQMGDPNFARAVVLLCKHSPTGAFGVVVNRPLVTQGRVTVTLDPPVSTDRELQVWVGGPVEQQKSWILVGQEPRIAPHREEMRSRLATTTPAASSSSISCSSADGDSTTPLPM